MCVDAGTIHGSQPIDMFAYEHKTHETLKVLDADDDDADAAATAAASAAEHEASATLL